MTQSYIQAYLAHLQNTLLECKHDEWGLLDGKLGHLIYNIIYLSAYEDDKSLIYFQKRFERLLDLISSIENPSVYYANGLCGVLPLFTYLKTKDLIVSDNKIFEYLFMIRDATISSMHFDLQCDNIDFLYGSLGKAHAVLPYLNSDHSLIRFFIEYLYNHIVKHKKRLFSLNFKDGHSLMSRTYINTGMAHGIGGLLQFCNRCLQNKIYCEQITAIAWEIVRFLLQFRKSSPIGSNFPYVITQDKNNKATTRLGWCYGDLSLGLALLNISAYPEMYEAHGPAIAMLKQCADRKSLTETQIVDAGFCHGSSGVAHIFHKVWHITRDPLFYDTAEWWIRTTLNFADDANQRIAFNRYDASDNSYHTDYSLLEGMTGIGLVLYSWETGDCSWDSCLML